MCISLLGGSSVNNPPPSYPRRQHATSFEHETPSSNITAHNPSWQNDVLNRSRSPGVGGSSVGGYNENNEDDRFVELTVFLKRHDNGFGFRIVGGTEEGSQVSVTFVAQYNLVEYIIYLNNLRFIY